MTIKHAVVIADNKDLFPYYIVSFAVKLDSFDLRNLLN